MGSERELKKRKSGHPKEKPGKAPPDPGNELTPEQHEAQKEELERISVRAQSSGMD